jgi:hypothetical protein
MDNAPNASRTGFAGAPVVGLNWGAYVSSTSSHGIKEEKITQRLFVCNVPPKGK